MLCSVSFWKGVSVNGVEFIVDLFLFVNISGWNWVDKSKICRYVCCIWKLFCDWFLFRGRVWFCEMLVVLLLC